MSLQTENFALQSNRRRAQIPARHVADAHRQTAPLPARHYCVSRAISLTSVWSLRPLSPRLETTRGAPRPLATSSALSPPPLTALTGHSPSSPRLSHLHRPYDHSPTTFPTQS